MFWVEWEIDGTWWNRSDTRGYVPGISFWIDTKRFASDLSLPFDIDFSLPVVTLIVSFGEV